MCIIDGGVKMKGRMKKLVNYECENKACKKLWSLLPKLMITGSPPKFCGYDRNGYKKFRKEGFCECGTAFNHPHIIVDVKNRK